MQTNHEVNLVLRNPLLRDMTTLNGEGETDRTVTVWQKMKIVLYLS
jgi:hypothetical protein